MKKDRHKRFLRNADGAVAATYALALIPLIAVAGLAYDYTRLAGMDTELQNAADQAALAGATQLNRSTGSMQRAINAIQGTLVSNETLFSNVGSDREIAISNANLQVVFYSTRADAEAGTNGFTLASGSDANAGFVQVTVDTRAANYSLTRIVGALQGSLNAAAVAGLGSALCRIPPLMVCNPDEGTGATRLDVTTRRGQGLLAKPGGGSGGWFPGNYGYLDIGPNGATGVRQALGWDTAGGNCIDVTGSDVLDETDLQTEPGNVASGPQALNTRFDVYENQGCVGTGTCSPAYNVRKDLVRPTTLPVAAGTCDIKANSSWEEPLNAYHPNNAVGDYPGTIDSMGHPRDKCHAVPPSMNNFPTSGSCQDTLAFGDGEWDRNAYFRTHYVRSQGTSNGLMGSSWTEADWKREMLGALLDTDNDNVIDHGIAKLTRYEVYKWEEAKKRINAVVDGVAILGDRQVGSLTTRNAPVCGQIPAAAPPDRRVMSVAVVNCVANETKLSGKTEVPIAHFIDVFLVQPSYDRGQSGRFTKKDEIYVEIIRDTEIVGTGSVSGPTLRRDVPYLVK